ncbi:MAG: ABC transporter permease [Actinomycetota bacterium]
MNTPTPTTGVIHDIGYRHYDGERRGRSYIRRSLYIDSFKGAYGLGRSARYKVMPMILLALMCLPAAVIVAITAVTNSDELVGDYTSYILNLQLVVLIFLASQAPATVSRDLRFSVMSLYFSRPLERVDYVASKYAAMVSALFVLTVAPLTIMFAGALVVGLTITEQIPDYLRAVAGAGILSLILGGFGLVIAAITPRRGFAVAAIIAVLVVLAGVQTALQELAIAEGFDGASYLGLLSPFTLVQGVQSSLLGAAIPLPSPPGATGALVFSVAALFLVALSLAVLLLRYRSVKVS